MYPRKKDELNRKMKKLITMLYKYTAKHPRLQKYSLYNLINSNNLNSIVNNFNKDFVKKLMHFKLEIDVSSKNIFY